MEESENMRRDEDLNVSADTALDLEVRTTMPEPRELESQEVVISSLLDDDWFSRKKEEYYAQKERVASPQWKKRNQARRLGRQAARQRIA
jgi:hypothetical protein